MKERPILFSSAMVRAILDGRKTQTRRLVTQRDLDRLQLPPLEMASRPLCACPHGVVGDRLWVRETWTHDAESLDQCRSAFDCASVPGYGPYYRATEVAPDTLKWKPGIFMPRWASRITLEITEVRVQRLQEISEEDARAEGIEIDQPWCLKCDPEHLGNFTDRLPFADLWDSINGKRAPWESNPWVWCLTFKRLP